MNQGVESFHWSEILAHSVNGQIMGKRMIFIGL